MVLSVHHTWPRRGANISEEVRKMHYYEIKKIQLELSNLPILSSEMQWWPQNPVVGPVQISVAAVGAQGDVEH